MGISCFHPTLKTTTKYTYHTMKKMLFSKNSKIKVLSTLIIGSVVLYPSVANATGWETVSRAAFTCTQTGGAYTMEVEKFYLFGMEWGTRVTYRDGMNNIISDSCDQAGPGE